MVEDNLKFHMMREGTERTSMSTEKWTLDSDKDSNFAPLDSDKDSNFVASFDRHDNSTEEDSKILASGNNAFCSFF